VNETVIRKGIVIVTATGTGKRKETEIMTENATGTATGTEIGTGTANENENATAIVTVTVIGNVIATRTETVVPGTTAGTKMVDRATMVVTANGTGKATRHETVVTEIEIDTRYGDQILDGMRRNDAQGRRKIVVAVMTNLERSGSQKTRSEARKCVRISKSENLLIYSNTHNVESKVRHGGSFEGPQSSRRNARGGRDIIVYQAL
jgi:hypothetical protein